MEQPSRKLLKRTVKHLEMLDRELERTHQRRHNYVSLAIAFMAVVVAVIGINISAHYNMNASEIQANATLRASQMQIEAEERMAKMQIEAQKEMARQMPCFRHRRTSIGKRSCTFLG